MRAAILDQRIASVSYDWDGEDNASPSVQQVNGAVVCRNMANNPRFTRTSGTVEVRRNLFLDPRGTNTALWKNISSIGARVAMSSGGPIESPTWVKQVPDGNIPSRTPQFFTVSTVGGASDIAVVAGVTYFMSSGFIASVAGTVCIRAAFRNNSGTLLSEARSDPISVVPGKWVRPEGVFTIPSGATILTVYNLYLPSEVIPAADGYIGCTAGLLTASSVRIDYFDGSYSPDPDLTPVWVGTKNSSQSYLRGFAPGSTFTYNNFAVSSSNGVRLIPNDTVANDSHANIGGSTTTLSGLGVTFTPGKWYGFQAVRTLLAPQTGTLNFFARRMRLASNNVAGWTGVNSAHTIQQPNKAGSYQEELVTQLPPDSVWAVLRLHNGASFGNGDVYWDKLLIVEGDTEEEVRSKLAQGYFDGDTQVNSETINRVTNL